MLSKPRKRADNRYLINRRYAKFYGIVVICSDGLYRSRETWMPLPQMTLSMGLPSLAS